MEGAFKILLADDENAVVATVKVVLGGSGYRFESASDGRTALERIRERPEQFDLVITDERMPNLRGLDLVRQLRSMDFRGKIFVLSAYLSSETKSEYAALDVDRVMEKPFDLHELRAAVSGVAGSCGGNWS